METFSPHLVDKLGRVITTVAVPEGKVARIRVETLVRPVRLWEEDEVTLEVEQFDIRAEQVRQDPNHWRVVRY